MNTPDYEKILEKNGAALIAAEEVFWDLKRFRRAILKAMPYTDYLKTRDWKITRKTAIEKAMWHCKMCCTDHTPKQNTNGVWAECDLHVHHLSYERIGHEDPKDLMVLCAVCHSSLHPEKAGLV